MSAYIKNCNLRLALLVLEFSQISSLSSLVPQQKVRNLNGVSLRPIFAPECLPHLILIHPFQTLGQLIHNVVVDPAQPFNDLKVELLHGLHEGRQRAENGSGGGHRRKIARQVGYEPGVNHDVGDGEALDWVDMKHARDEILRISRKVVGKEVRALCTK